MALPATDAFTGSGPTALTTYSTNWTYNKGTFEVRSNACGPTNGGDDSLARWNADTFGDDQFAEATVVTRVSSEYAGVAVRIATGGAVTGYGYYWNDTIGQLFRYVAGTWTQIGSDQTAPVNGDVVRLEVSGTTLTVKYDGSTIYSQSDANIASGAAGICGYGNAGAGLIDDFNADNLSSVTYEQEGFRFRNDDGSETTATWKASQDTNASVGTEENFRLRFLINRDG